MHKNTPLGDRESLELAQTAKARFETTEAAAEHYGFELGRVEICNKHILDGIHRSANQKHVLWVLEIAQGMITAVMAVNGEPLPVSDKVDPASYAMAMLRDIAKAAQAQGLDFASLESQAAASLKTADAEGFTHLETYWAINQATASCELAWARSLAEDSGSDTR